MMKQDPASEGRSLDGAPPPLRCAVQGFAPLLRFPGNSPGPEPVRDAAWGSMGTSS